MTIKEIKKDITDGQQMLFTKSDVLQIIDEIESSSTATAEQMQGWLTDKLGITTWYIRYFPCCDEPGYGYLIIGQDVVLEYDNITNLYKTPKEATLAAIDAALDYLSKNKK